MIRFRTGHGLFAVPVEHALEVCSAAGMLTLPEAGAGVAGMLPRNREAISVISALGPGKDQILVLDAGTGTFGLLVQEVIGVAKIDDADISAPPAGQQDRLLTGVIATPAGLEMIVDVSVLGARLMP